MIDLKAEFSSRFGSRCPRAGRLVLRPLLALMLAAMFTVVAPAPAHAQGTDPSPAVPTTVQGSSPSSVSPNWFGWQIAAVDVSAIVLIVGGGALTSMSTPFAFLPILGGATYFVGGPLVHLRHTDHGGAGRSVLLRVGLPVGAGALGAGIGALASSGGPSDVCSNGRACAAIGGAAIGVAAGMIAAMVTDWILASDPVPDPHSATGDASPPWFVTAVPLPGGSAFAITGSF